MQHNPVRKHVNVESVYNRHGKELFSVVRNPLTPGRTVLGHQNYLERCNVRGRDLIDDTFDEGLFYVGW